MKPPDDERGAMNDEQAFDEVHRSSFIVHRYNRRA